ncbi:MAG: hypothetical protein BGO43_15035 [Gammaproteobacteria bacterium 39-13]|nr:MAG: hypothetical protein BGO43_15035 [Gammaproteobacteria bacterium 39-13]
MLHLVIPIIGMFIDVLIMAMATPIITMHQDLLVLTIDAVIDAVIIDTKDLLSIIIPTALITATITAHEVGTGVVGNFQSKVS